MLWSEKWETVFREHINLSSLPIHTMAFKKKKKSSMHDLEPDQGVPGRPTLQSKEATHWFLRISQKHTFYPKLFLNWFSIYHDTHLLNQDSIPAVCEHDVEVCKKKYFCSKISGQSKKILVLTFWSDTKEKWLQQRHRDSKPTPYSDRTL